MKKCKDCPEDNKENFYVTKWGYQYARCKRCRNARTVYKRDKERAAEYQRKWRLLNPDYAKEMQQIYRDR